MLLAPSLSPSSGDSPSTTSTPPPQPLPVVQPPLVSPPSPSTVVSPPLLTPLLAPITTPATPPPSSPPAAIVIIPVTPPQPPTPPIDTSPPPPPPPPPPAATSISPVVSPPHSPSPALVTASPPLPTTTPASHPQPSTFWPSTSPLPSPTPPTLPSVILPPPGPARKVPSLPPPRPPTDALPFNLVPPPRPPTDALPFTSVPPPPTSRSIGVPKAPESSEPFQFPAPPPPLPLAVGKGALPAGKQGLDSPIGLIVACIGVGILLFLVFAAVCICCRRKQKPLEDNKKQQCLVIKDGFSAAPTQHENEKVAPPRAGSHVITVPTEVQPPPPFTKCGSNNSGPVTALNSSCGIFSYDELVVATNGFSELNLLGEGGFGYVHKGVLRSGQEVAVKQLKAGSHQGEREFQAEVETISRVHHKHLVSLVGYCITGAERLLVYEFVPNKTLGFHLHENGQPVMSWENRLKIAIGSAKGIAYLHEDCSPTIIHRDIKAANILLDPRFEAKVSDFGLAKIFPDASSSSTHISTRMVGTFGYLAPEYASTGKLTDKSDVYSYGVVLLELITGRAPITKKESSINESLVDYARPLLARALEDNDFDVLADPKLQGAYNKREMASMVTCAAACIRQSAWLRPRMSQVVRALEGDISLSYLDGRSRSWNSSIYTSSEIMIQKRDTNYMALAGKNSGISRNSETTSEYGLNPSGSSSEFHINN